MVTSPLFRSLILSGSIGCVICTFPGDEVCTEIAVAGVSLTLADHRGVPVEHASVMVDAGGPRQPCDDLGFGEYACAWEQSGPMTLFVNADGFKPQIVEVEVDHDGCHPVPVSVDLTLEPDVVCTEEAVASVVLSLVDEHGAAISDARATYTVDANPVREACTSAGDLLVCGVERTGTFLIDVEAPNFEGALLEYRVELDEAGCHPVTVVDEVLLAGTCG